METAGERERKERERERGKDSGKERRGLTWRYGSQGV